MADKTIKVHRRVTRMIFPIIQSAKNDRSVRRALPVYDNELTSIELEFRVVTRTGRHSYNTWIHTSPRLLKKKTKWNDLQRVPQSEMSRRMTKPTKWSVRPAKTQIRVFAVRILKTWVLCYPLSDQRRLRSDWADAQADLSLRWAHSHFVGFVMRRLRSQPFSATCELLLSNNQACGSYFSNEMTYCALYRWITVAGFHPFIFTHPSKHFQMGGSAWLDFVNSHKQFAVFLFKFKNVNNESSVALAAGLKLTGDIADWVKTSSGPHQANLVLIAYASSEGSVISCTLVSY